MLSYAKLAQQMLQKYQAKHEIRGESYKKETKIECYLCMVTHLEHRWAS